jgi:hypothetical protein
MCGLYKKVRNYKANNYKANKKVRNYKANKELEMLERL